MKGRLVAFEGIDRAGKSTAVRNVSAALDDCLVAVTSCSERDSPLGPLLEPSKLPRLSPFLKAYLFAADRAWTYEKKAQVALAAGHLVFWDRYVDSAYAYRGAERALGRSDLNPAIVRALNAPFVRPDLVVYIDIMVDVSSERGRNGQLQEAYDVPFLEEVRRQYDSLAKAECYCRIDGSGTCSQVADAVAAVVRSAFPDLFPCLLSSRT
ncbi:MAG: dTMP kinase [Actinomycetia bacterium]|nr:dTMP kinase [Actinomycetes bacterium]